MNRTRLQKILMAAALGEKVEDTENDNPVKDFDEGTGEVVYIRPSAKAEKKEEKKTKPPKKIGKSEALLGFERAEWAVHLGNAIPEEFDKPSTLMLYGNGVWLRRENPLGAFLTKLREANLPTLPDGPDGSFESALPKIPSSILKEMASFYRQVMARFRGAEAFCIVFYDKEEEKYFLHVPSQKVSGTSVKYDQEKLREAYPSTRYLEVISAHSHNSMGAYFSSIDDNDEKGDMLYLVMGKLNQPVPAYKMRANTGGKQCCFLSIGDIFEITEQEWNLESPTWKNLHSKEWLEALNISSSYMSPHSLGSGTPYSTRSSRRQAGGAPYQFGKRPPVTWPSEDNGGLPSPKSWPTSTRRPTQQAFDFKSSGADGYEELFIGYTALELAKDCRKLPVDQSLATFFEALSNAGYIEEIRNALNDSGVSDLLNATTLGDDEDLDALYEEFRHVLEREDE